MNPSNKTISVIQILRVEGLNYRQIIFNNFNFLNNLGVEYVVYDNLNTFEVLIVIKDLQKSFPNLKYVKEDFLNTKTSFLKSAEVTDGNRLIYLKSVDLIHANNLEMIEKNRPNIFKDEIYKVRNIKQNNFKYDDFNLLIKENKSLFEKLLVKFK